MVGDPDLVLRRRVGLVPADRDLLVTEPLLGLLKVPDIQGRHLAVELRVARVGRPLDPLTEGGGDLEGGAVNLAREEADLDLAPVQLAKDVEADLAQAEVRNL